MSRLIDQSLIADAAIEKLCYVNQHLWGPQTANLAVQNHLLLEKIKLHQQRVTLLYEVKDTYEEHIIGVEGRCRARIAHLQDEKDRVVAQLEAGVY